MEAVSALREGLYSVAVRKLDQAIQYEKDDVKRKDYMDSKSQVLQMMSTKKRVSSSPTVATTTTTTTTAPSHIKKKLCWDDVSGLENVKTMLKMLSMLPRLDADQQNRKGNVVLMYGPPGTGKTLLCRVLAAETNSEYFELTSVDFVNEYQGKSERNIRDAFQQANQGRPVVLFVDEIDSIATKRQSGEQESTRRIKTTLLTEMQNVTDNNPDAIILLATNKPDDLDEGIKRRITHTIYIPPPTEEDRIAIVTHDLKKTPNILTTTDIRWIAVNTPLYTGSDLARMLKGAEHVAKIELMNTTMFSKDENGRYRVGGLEEINIEGLLAKGAVVYHPITMVHIKQSLEGSKPTCTIEMLAEYDAWTELNGKSGK